ncbi:MAG: T9SS type A sorting domain-containing protein [Paludibacter sp.]
MSIDFIFDKTKSLFIFILVAFTHLVFGATFYTSPTGTSSAGSFASPMNLTSAFSLSLSAGDSIVLRGGLYNFSSSQTISKTGTAEKNIHIVAYKNENPILDFRTQPYSSSNIGLKISGNYLHVKGITVQGAGDNGIQVTGNYNWIEFCTTRWNCDSGLQLKTGSNNLISNCDSYENFDYMTGGTSSPDYGGNADGFADKQYTNVGINTFNGCRSWRNSDDGWDHFEKIGTTVIDSCWCYANGPASFDMTEHIRFKTDSAVWFSKFKNTSGRYVVKNYGNGNGFKLGGNYTAHNATLYHCVSVQNTVKGFDQNNNNGTMTIFNCTGYQNNSDYGFSNSSYGSLIIKNCASLNSKSTNVLKAKTVTQTNNSWNTGYACITTDFESLDVSQLLATRQSNGSLPEISLLHQSATSGMIDKGINIGKSFLGTSPDLGAFEYGVKTAISDLSLSNETRIMYSETTHEIIFSGMVNNISIYNMLGQKIVEYNDISTININTTNWNKGVYIAVIKDNNNKLFSRKLRIK